jgi:hypothetical protein
MKTLSTLVFPGSLVFQDVRLFTMLLHSEPLYENSGNLFSRRQFYNALLQSQTTESSRLLLCSRILFCTDAAAIIAVLVSKPLQENSRRVLLCFPGDGFVLVLTAARSKFGEVSMSKELFLCMYKKKARGAAEYTVMVETNDIF